SKLKGFHTATCHFSHPKEETKGEENICLLNYSFLRALKQNIAKGETLFRDGFLFILEKEAKEVEQLTPYIEKGYEFYYFYPEEQLEGTLATLGLLTIHLIPSNDNDRRGLYGGFGINDDRTISMFSEKMYKFVSWLEFNNKIENEPKIEFVKFAVRND
ncbi:MAG: hypothetical protein LC778_01490, partial [Acidobacteria bacterium]|nr:hypothetical protein [Acidobacteriota bacterium]